MDKNSLSHTKWECKYHIVFAPEYRRQVIYGNIKADVANILSTLCKRKGVEIIEAECCRDHVHLVVNPISYVSGQGRLYDKSALYYNFMNYLSMSMHLNLQVIYKKAYED